uniref:Cysteine-rich protein 1 n=1 Tax=Haplochromis burtoni TaxID=8153 RepID=A0A3Q2WBV3_HAPBU
MEKKRTMEVLRRVRTGEKKRSLGRDYHPLCLKCQKCNRQLTPGQHAEYDEKPYCTHCYLKMFGPRGILPSQYENTNTHNWPTTRYF